MIYFVLPDRREWKASYNMNKEDGYQETSLIGKHQISTAL